MRSFCVLFIGFFPYYYVEIGTDEAHYGKHVDQYQIGQPFDRYKRGIEMVSLANGDNTEQTRKRVAIGSTYVTDAIYFLLLKFIWVDQGINSDERELVMQYQQLSEPLRAKVEEAYERYKQENIKAGRLSSFHIDDGLKKMVFNEANDPDRLIDVLEMHNEAYDNFRYALEPKEGEGRFFQFNFGYMDAFYRALKDTLDALLQERRIKSGL